MRIKVNLV